MWARQARWAHVCERGKQTPGDVTAALSTLFVSLGECDFTSNSVTLALFPPPLSTLFVSLGECDFTCNSGSVTPALFPPPLSMLVVSLGEPNANSSPRGPGSPIVSLAESL